MPIKERVSEERRALGSFLVDRRARLKPGELGLPEVRRRTPGLRREEVAHLAEVSVSWYTWLEQGRDIRVSALTLKRVSQALRLDRAETEHLFALASQVSPPHLVGEDLTEGLSLLIKAIDPLPAYIRNSRLDILVWNPAVADLFIDYGNLDPYERNTLRLLFLNEYYRTLIVDWESLAREMMGTFRAARAKAKDKVPFDELIEELSSKSREFVEWWPNLDVKNFGEGSKRLHHPRLGLVELSYVALSPQERPELSLVTYARLI